MLKKASSRGPVASAVATGRSHRSNPQRTYHPLHPTEQRVPGTPRVLARCGLATGRRAVLARAGLGGCDKAFLNILHGIRSGSRFLVCPGFTDRG